MYRSCLACRGTLEPNEHLPTLPIGRMVAFDPERGRLWVVCQRCGRWNLVPLEQRWEAIQRCKQLHTEWPMVSQGPSLSVARGTDGFEVIRVGDEDPEALLRRRLQDRLHRRAQLELPAVVTWPRRRRWILGASTAVASVGLMGAGIAAGGLLAPLAIVALLRAGLEPPRQGVVRIGAHTLDRRALNNVRLVATDDDYGWMLALPGRWTLSGRDAVHAIYSLLPLVNRFNPDPETIERALTHRAKKGPGFHDQLRAAARRYGPGRSARLAKLARHERLALEIGAEEALESGDATDLEAAWARAEELAAISDDLLIPSAVERTLAALRRERNPEGPGAV
ncbi:MAG: hypothetical protein R3E10_08425 [Gemmatimonadota bacterium]